MSPSTKCSAIIVGAGSGERFGASDKVIVKLAGVPLIEHSIRIFSSCRLIHEIIVVLSRETYDAGQNVVACYRDQIDIRTCTGGATRSESVRSGLAQVSHQSDLVAVHDGARPLLTTELLEQLVRKASSHGAAVPGIAVGDSVLLVDDDGIPTSALNRATLRTVQTPQVARREWLMDALLQRSYEGTDESSALLEAGYPVRIVEGDPENIKITWPRDLRHAEDILKARLRCG